MEDFKDLKIDGFMKEHNFKLVSFDTKECVLEAPITDTSLNPYKITHGGFIFGLMDTCGGVHLLLETKRKVVTTSSNVNFLKPGIGKKIIVKSTPIKIGKILSVMKVDAYNDKEDLIATGTFNFYYID